MAIPQAILKRHPTWLPSQAPPGRYRGYAYKLADGRLSYASRKGGVLKGAIDESRMCATAIISTIDRDRVGDEVVPEGCLGRGLEAYSINPKVFIGHQSVPTPVGEARNPKDGMLAVQVNPGENVMSTCYFFQNTKEGQQYFQLVKDGVYSATSIGFTPYSEPIKLDYVPGNVYAGHRYEEWELLEWSWVGVPANPWCGLVRSYLARGTIAGEKISPVMRKSLEPLAEPKKAWSQGFTAKPIILTPTHGQQPLTKLVGDYRGEAK